MGACDGNGDFLEGGGGEVARAEVAIVVSVASVAEGGAVFELEQGIGLNLPVAHIGVEKGFFFSEGCAVVATPPIIGFSGGGGCGAHESVIVIGGVERPGEAYLFEIAQRLSGFGGGFCLGEDGEEDGGEDRDDGDDDE